MKKGIVIGIVIIAALGVVALGYWLSKPKMPVISQNPSSGTLPDSESRTAEPAKGELKSELSAVFNEGIQNYAVTKDGVVVGITSRGKIMKAQGESRMEISRNAPSGFFRGAITSDGMKALGLVGDPQDAALFIFESSSTQWKSAISHGVTDAAWSPFSTSTLAYLLRNNEKISLFILNTASVKNKPQEVFSLRAEDLRIVWNGANSLILISPPSALTDTIGFQVNLKEKTFISLFEGTQGGDVIWSANGEVGLLFKSSDAGRGGILQVIQNGSPSRTLNFNTLSSKCGFDLENILFCAVPEDQRTLALSTLPDAYYQREIMSKDTIYRIDLESGKLESWFESDRGIDAVKLTPLSGQLYFINRYDNKLWRIKK